MIDKAIKLPVFVILLCVSTFSHAEPEQDSYAEQFISKSGNALANITTGWLEVPKNIYITTRETNIIYGFIGGTGMGIFHLAGRIATGVFNLITAPVPSDPIVNPHYIWNDFGTKTTYAVQFYLEEPSTETAPQ